jgi:hypothetical protein
MTLFRDRRFWLGFVATLGIAAVYIGLVASRGRPNAASAPDQPEDPARQ